MNFRIAARIADAYARSLVWEGDSLVDWVSGGKRFQLDGTVIPRPVNYPYRFDAACGSPSGRYAVLYERLGTKGLLLDEGKILREIDRSYYFADDYEFPVCIAQLESGREVLIHCPEEYNRLEIDDIETGERLTKCDERKPTDYFHSRLTLGPNGIYFLSAGWIWHPVDSLGVYRLEDAVRDPKSLDEFGVCRSPLGDISSAAFVDEHFIVFSESDETLVDKEVSSDGDVFRPSSLTIWDITEFRMISDIKVLEPIGTLMAIDSRYVVSFYDHPKLIDLRTGQVIARLNDVKTGKQTSSIIHHIEPVPPLALDPQRCRFAVATATEILVVAVDSTE